MSKKVFSVALVLTLISGLSGIVFALDQWSGEGEVVEMGCYEKREATGAGHAACAKKCLTGGAEMGLLLEDGSIVKLVAGENEAAYKSLIDLAGMQAKVSGSEADGTVTVMKSGAAS